jgi:nucleotide-binding universal stress UspA family protein
VVGSRGRGAFRSAFLGSVSNSLVGVARCPVLIVPPGAEVRQEAGGLLAG